MRLNLIGSYERPVLVSGEHEADRNAVYERQLLSERAKKRTSLLKGRSRTLEHCDVIPQLQDESVALENV
jgi:hypothetical protein